MTVQVPGWLLDTLLYTGLLIALVLVLRRPVARYFGPQVAYALWALPLLRFVIPPLVLPAWMAPAREHAAQSEPAMLFIADAPTSAAAPAVAAAPQVAIGLIDLLLPLWLGGAALFLTWRVRSYIGMRRELLADARPVGEAGRVRLVETPAVASPLAFGVRDKVVALPLFFMAHPDRTARDMAIEHELAHHRGHDLLANFAAQPLLALHWFNPIAWAGWRAMRKDQEAACDARVVAGRERSDRAAYAQVIAGFAAGDSRLAFAAPMACPVLGEKSIIHRLRSLARNEISPQRRRSGLAAIGLAALALPLTASISCAAPRSAPPALLAAAAPSAPRLAPTPPALPAAPEAPLPAAAPEAPQLIEEDEQVERRTERRIERRVVVRRDFDEHARHEAFAEMERELEALEILNEIIDGAVAEALAEAERATAESHHARAVAHAEAGKVRVEMTCEGDEPVVERDLGKGRRAILICTSAIDAKAAEGLREARREIAEQEDLSREQRERVLRQLDRQIERLSHRQLSFGTSHWFRPAIAPAASFAPVAAPACPVGEVA